MAHLNINFDDVLAEIERLSNQNPEGFSMAEMSASTGHSEEWCRTRIKKMIDADKAFCNGRAKRFRIDGMIGYVPVYLIKHGKNK